MQLQVLTSAQLVRAWAEERAIRELFPANLLGLCARSSAMLYLLLKKHGLSPSIGYSKPLSHMFIIIDEHIVDVTATQYFSSNYIPIHVIRLSNSINYSQYQLTMTFPNLFRMIRYQHRVDWRTKELPSRKDKASLRIAEKRYKWQNSVLNLSGKNKNMTAPQNYQNA